MQDDREVLNLSNEENANLKLLIVRALNRAKATPGVAQKIHHNLSLTITCTDVEKKDYYTLELSTGGKGSSTSPTSNETNKMLIEIVIIYELIDMRREDENKFNEFISFLNSSKINQYKP